MYNAVEESSANSEDLKEPKERSYVRGVDEQDNRRRYPCPQCGTRFTLSKNMKRHYRYECGKEPQYQCSYCAVKFKRNNQLQDFGPSGDRVYVLASETHLNEISGHDRMYQHTCPRCQKMYTYKKNLQRHLKFECGVEPMEQCRLCSYVTRYRHSLKSHMNLKHRNVQFRTSVT
uniref:C2H2-type domain-containing protein n=1 Tax=Lutzomyia longipalpis TaxID=7200 RepID=A0A1B0CV31_LUTLO